MAGTIVMKTLAYRIDREGVTFMIRDKDGSETSFLVSPQHLLTLMGRVASAAADAMQFVDDDEANQLARVMIADRIGTFQTTEHAGVLIRLQNGAKLPIALAGDTLHVPHAAAAALLQSRTTN